MKSFEIPDFYRSHLISKLKSFRKLQDPRKKDFTPTVLDYGNMEIMLPRHFGFCYGVENAIEICYKALNDHPGKRVYLLSQMIHNQEVNSDLQDRGILFLQDTQGNELLSFDILTSNDVVVIPAFGTTVEMLARLKGKGVDVQAYNTTCPFVEKVWKRSNKLGDQEFTVVIHGKPKHEETRATFSHSNESAKSIVIKNMEEAKLLGSFIKGEKSKTEFYQVFGKFCSEGFDPEQHLKKMGVVNQTTMLATETQAIADHLKLCIIDKFGEEHYKDHFADTRDTLCYATNDNQQATYGMLEEGADIAIVVGGYNSSNTSHLVELCEEKMPTFFIKNEEEIESLELINHFDWRNNKYKTSSSWLPLQDKPRIIVTSGASCPDSVVERVIEKILFFGQAEKDTKSVLQAAIS